MKTIHTSLMTLISNASLLSCSNMSNQDAGVLTEAVADGLIGGDISKNMDDMDRMKMNRALENHSVGEPICWLTSHSGAFYHDTPVKNMSVQCNSYCHAHSTTAMVAGKKQQIYGTACRQPDGSWRMMN